MTVFALAIPFGGLALASHTGADNSHTLEVAEETASNPTGKTHTLTATVSGGSCGASVATGCEVDFEIESGPAVRVGVTGDQGTGGTASNDGNTPTTPDMTCTAVGPGPASCTVTFTSDTAGTNVVRAWVDDDKDNASFDADQTEGRDEATTPGSRTEPDDTDVVSKSWFAATAANAAIDCVDESGDDTQTNPPGEAETYTCTTFDDNGTGGGTAGNAVRDGSEPVIPGQKIDLEIAGANDPDNRGFAADPANTTADRDNACTTGTNGTCTIVISPTKNETGTANVCFWIDADDDAQFAGGGGEKFDGGQCQAENAPGNESTSLVSDVVTKTWAQPTATTLDAAPEVDNNASGTSHTVTAEVKDQFGNAAAGVPVDFTITLGRNLALGTICNDVLTNASGTATCTYTDAGTSTSSGQDTIRVNREGTVDQTEGRNESTSPGGTPEPDLTDVVTKFWTAGGPPAAATVIVDMKPATDTSANGNFCDDAADSADPQEVGNNNAICGVVRDSTGAGIPGKTVTVTYDGPGEFGSDTNQNGRLDAGEGQGKTITLTADETGRWDATLFSTETGTGTVTATADSASDTGTKTWTTPAAGARNIDCEPDTATNAPGTDHVWTCTVTDRYGNPVPGVSVTPSETGPGRLQSSSAQPTDANGQVEFVTSSTVNEEGDQSLTAELTLDLNDTDTSTDLDEACDQPQGTTLVAEPGTGGGNNQSPAPAGNCENTVTKTWGEVGPQPECSDGVDNDNDGKIDFPADPGCENAADDDESDFPTQVFGGDAGQPVTSGACAGFTTGSVQNNPNGSGLMVVGTEGDDALQGGEADDVICALGGDDAVQGHGGDDTIYGGGGKDGIEAGLGNDTVFGEGDKDIVLGDDGNDTLNGGQGNDNMSGGGGADVLRGQGGWDTLKGNAGNDLLVGAKGRDILQGGGGSDTARGGADDDVLKGFSGNDVLRGGGGDDIIKGATGRDRLFGNAGDDFLHGGPGRDFCRGGRGNDVLRSCP